jgi:hypothetical protein
MGRWIVEASLEICKPFRNLTDNTALYYDPDFLLWRPSLVDIPRCLVIAGKA